MKALINLCTEVFAEIIRATFDLLSTDNIGGMADNYQGGQKQ